MKPPPFAHTPLRLRLWMLTLWGTSLLVGCAYGTDDGTDDASAGGDADGDSDGDGDGDTDATGPIDGDATGETKRLYAALRELAESEQIIFGQANPTTLRYADGKNGDLDQSDCDDIVGSHPGFHESDIMWYDPDPTFTAWDLTAMRQAYDRGALTGYAWHLDGRWGAFNDPTSNAELCTQIVENTNESRDWLYWIIDKELIPVVQELGFPLIFRPFHEMNGGWFWWGRDNCTTDQFKQLYRLTVDYILSRDVHNLLYAWSPDKSGSFAFYPGDDYVDIIGYDGYELGEAISTATFLNQLAGFIDYAAARGKLVALTETGYRNGYPTSQSDYWTAQVLHPIVEHDTAWQIAWIMSWYNSPWNGWPYIPYDGMNDEHADLAVADFVAFHDHSQTLFEDDLPDLYRRDDQQAHRKNSSRVTRFHRPAPPVTPPETNQIAILDHPAPVSAIIRSPVSFEVRAAGRSLTYQWQIDVTGAGRWRDLAGKTAPTLSTFTPFPTHGPIRYRCVIDDQAGDRIITRPAVLTATLQAPRILSHPNAGKVRPGERLTLSVSAKGEHLTYTWSKNGVPIAGADQSRFTTAPLSKSDHGAVYRCRVTDSFGGPAGQTIYSDCWPVTVVLQSPPLTN